MKKMKCESCGGTLRVEDNGEYARCDFCRAKYKLDDKLDVNVNFKMDDKITDTFNQTFKMARTSFSAISIIFILFFIIMIVIAVFSFVGKKESGISNNDYSNTFNVAAHNNPIKMYSGKQSKFFLESLLDNINENNKTDDIKILIKFKDNEYSVSEDIIMLKQMLEKKDYEVDFEYNSDGYIIACNILDIY